MSKKVGFGYEVTGYEPIDVRQILTKEQMKSIVGDESGGGDFAMPEVYFALCIDDGQFYRFDYGFDPDTGDPIRDPDPETGYFTKMELGGTTPEKESGPISERPSADDVPAGTGWYDPETGKTYVVSVDSEGNKAWVEQSPKSGEMFYDKEAGKIMYFDGNAWREVGGTKETVVSDSAPSDPQPGDTWVNPTTNETKVYVIDSEGTGHWEDVDAKAGEMMYDAVNNVILFFDGTEWKPIGGGVEHVSVLPAAGEEGEIVYDESTGQYKVYEDGVWLTLAKTWEGTEAQYTTLGGDTWSVAHPDVIMFING